MELTIEEYRLYEKNLRRKFAVVGWILLAYYGLMNGCVFLWAYVQMVFQMIGAISSGEFSQLTAALETALSGAGGYFLAAGIGLLIVLLWKKPVYWKKELWARGKPMKLGSFLGLMCIFFSGQLVYQIVMIITESVLNMFGLSALAGMEAVSMDMDNFGMFLYGGILAPVLEELLFRGLVQRTLMPYGKRFAILCSAFTFGIFHGNLFQTPYAFLVGLVLGYVASEYSIAWAMVLHMLNNLVLGDMLLRLTAGMGHWAASLAMWAILLLSAIGALVTLIVRREDIRTYRRENPIYGVYSKCFFGNLGTVILMVVMGFSMISTIFVMITPL